MAGHMKKTKSARRNIKTNIMKKLIYIITSFVLLTPIACNEDKEEATLYKKNIELSFIEYAALPKGSYPATNKCFTQKDPARNYLPAWLSNLGTNIGDGSSAIISYDYKDAERPERLVKLEIPADKFNDEDYKEIWGNPFVETLTPSKDPNSQIPLWLAKKYPSAKSGDYKLVEYFYSDEEPSLKTNTTVTYLLETFDNIGESSFSDLGWLNLTANSTRAWISRVASGISRAMYTPNGQPAGTKSDAWLISKELDFSSAVSPKFSFDIAAGYYTKHCISILISDSYQEGNNPTYSQWTDITDSFNIPRSGPAGYGVLQTAGELALLKYAGKKIRIAFRYTGLVDPELELGTTYEIDNIIISEVTDIFSVSHKEKQRKLFIFNGTNWEEVSENEIYVLQDSDYKNLQLQSIDAQYTENILVSFLKINFSGKENGSKITLMYNTGIDKLSANEFSFKDGKWQLSSLPSIIIKKDKYIYEANAKQWNFVSEE